MALPIIHAPLYTTTVPSTKKEIKYRPFLVKEEKSLLLAQQSEEPQIMVDTLKDIIKNCITGDIDINSLAIFDYEYLFTQIRAKSVGEIAELVFLCDDCTDEKAKVLVKLDLTKFKVITDPEHSMKISLYDDIGVMMKYPTIETLVKLEEAANGNLDAVFAAVADCLDFVYTNEEVFHISEEPKEEVLQFLESLTQQQFGKIEEFFKHIPKMSQPIEYDCPVCHKHHEKVMEGMESFF